MVDDKLTSNTNNLLSNGFRRHFIARPAPRTPMAMSWMLNVSMHSPSSPDPRSTYPRPGKNQKNETYMVFDFWLSGIWFLAWNIKT